VQTRYCLLYLQATLLLHPLTPEHRYALSQVAATMQRFRSLCLISLEALLCAIVARMCVTLAGENIFIEVSRLAYLMCGLQMSPS
jgi:hypothetical protein